MPTEGAVETVVDQNAGGTSTNDGGNKDAATQTNNGQSDATKKPATGTSPANEDYEKRFKGVTADLQKERKTRQQFEARVAKYEADLAAADKRIKALAGVEVRSDADTEAEAIRARFKQLYPHLGDITAEDVAAIRELKQKRGEMDETTKHYWSTHSRKMVKSVQTAIEKELGGELSDRQRTSVERLYALRAEADPEFLERHSNGDESLVSEFAKEFLEDWFEPARRKVTQQETQRFRAVPSGKDRGLVTHGDKKINVTDDKAVEDMLVKGWRERNGDFGRR